MAELRQIRTLRLRASRREQVARSAIALEDALRTASLPQLPRGAILLVRRLDLGRLSADASPQWLSRHIETRLQALQLPPARPRHDAPSAELVWFADRSEALAVLLATSLHGAPRAWYWAGVLPGWRAGMTLRELLPRALRQAEAEPRAAAGVAGVAALLERLLRLDRLDPVLEHLEPHHLAPQIGSASAPAATAPSTPSRPQDIVGARPEFGKPSEVVRAPPLRRVTVSPIANDAWRPVLTRWFRRWGAADRRSRWLAAHALVAVHGPAAAAHADRLIAHLTGPAPEPRAAPTQARIDRPVRRSSERAPTTPQRGPRTAGPVAEADATLPEPEPTRGAAHATSPEVLSDARMETLPAAEPDWQPSRHGGLLLLLPALARLEIAEADPDGDLCLCLLHRIADRLRIRKDDAIRRALPKPLPRTAPRAFVPPQAWRSLLRLPHGADLGREDCLLAACQLVLARFLRRYARNQPAPARPASGAGACDADAYRPLLRCALGRAGAAACRSRSRSGLGALARPGRQLPLRLRGAAVRAEPRPAGAAPCLRAVALGLLARALPMPDTEPDTARRAVPLGSGLGRATVGAARRLPRGAGARRSAPRRAGARVSTSRASSWSRRPWRAPSRTIRSSGARSPICRRRSPARAPLSACWPRCWRRLATARRRWSG